MSENENLITTQTADQKKQAFVITAIRGFAIFMLVLGISSVTNVGGFALHILGNDQMCVIFGATACFVGVIEMFLVPFFLKKGWEKAEAAKK
jgi:hypothetical protein